MLYSVPPYRIHYGWYAYTSCGWLSDVDQHPWHEGGLPTDITRQHLNRVIHPSVFMHKEIASDTSVMGCTTSQSESQPSSEADHNADKSRRCTLVKKLETSDGIPVALLKECEVDCEICGLVFQASKEWGLPQPITGQQPYRGELQVSLISSAEAGTSYLSIRAGLEKGASRGRRVQFYAIEGRSHVSLATFSLRVC